ncbi:lon protease homolog [Striga asiatica]|uniref:Lon protease homolog n=1 Tax=Striga asiatica TaxID=4170 RepID=A0A5A7P2L6_STRAF|nr:lon protease homolog [Striga asiatica]
MTWHFELDDLNGPVLVGPFGESADGWARVVCHKGPLAVGSLGLEEESIEHDFGGYLRVDVAAREDFFELSAGHAREADEAEKTGGKDFTALVGPRVVGPGPLEDEVVDCILGGHLQVIGMWRNNRLQYLIHEATSNLSAAIITSSKAVGVVLGRVLLLLHASSFGKIFDKHYNLKKVREEKSLDVRVSNSLDEMVYLRPESLELHIAAQTPSYHLRTTEKPMNTETQESI